MSTTAFPPPPTHHHHRTRFIAHRIQESLPNRFTKFLCSLLLSLLLAAAILLFFLLLVLRPHRPRFHLSSFSAASLGSPQPAFSFSASIRNPNRQIGIHYDAISGSVYYRSDRLGPARLVSGPFYQPPKNTTRVAGAAEGRPEDGAAGREVAADAAAGRVGFWVEFRSTIRFRVRTWDTHRHRVHVSCDVEVGADGEMLPEYRDKRCSIYFI